MKRKILKDLSEWLKNKHRKPLVLRGARQVGKTWLVRELARKEKIPLIEVNLEKNPEYADLFREKSPEKVLISLEKIIAKRIDRNNSLLFLDEIQKSPWILSHLRWFYEDLPELPVIVTGSLLDFSLKNHTFSMPVGRITYLFLEPMSFKEFLEAQNEELLVEFIENYTIQDKIPELLHKKIMDIFKTYIITGGMPAIVKEWMESRSPVAITRLQQDLLNTFSDDFNKYSGKVPADRLRKMMISIPLFFGQKLKYSNIDKTEKSNALKHALNLLCMARVCHKVINTKARGIPLGAQEDERTFKVIFLDTGLASGILGLVLKNEKIIPELLLINKGGIAEQVVGQILRSSFPGFIDPKLHYYVRDVKGSESEIDYIIQLHTEIIPIEVKSGATGSLKSLHQFMAERRLTRAIRINSEPPCSINIDVKTTTGVQSKYDLISVPFYLTSEITRLLHPDR